MKTLKVLGLLLYFAFVLLTGLAGMGWVTVILFAIGALMLLMFAKQIDSEIPDDLKDPPADPARADWYKPLFSHQPESRQP